MTAACVPIELIRSPSLKRKSAFARRLEEDKYLKPEKIYMNTSSFIGVNFSYFNVH